MFRLNLVLLLCTCTCTGASPQVARATACFHPGTYSKKFADAVSVAGNPASLVSIKSFTAGVYAERRFMLGALQSGMLSAAFPLMNGGAGIHLNYTGDGAFVQSEAGIAYAKRLGKAAIGVRFSYCNLLIRGYGQSGTFLADIASMWQLTDKLYAGLTLCNPVGGALGSNGEKVARSYKAGLGYDLSDQLVISAECIKEEDRPINIRSALQYEPVPACMLQLGIATANAQPFIGVGLQWNRLRICMNIAWHARLGFSPALALMYAAPAQTKHL